MVDAKTKIRKGTLYNRRLLKSDVWGERVLAIQGQFMALVEEKKIGSCHLFLPIKRNKEFDTWPLVVALYQKGIDVLLSVSDFETQRMTHYQYNPNLKFENNKLGIPEPVGAEAAEVSNVELILIPLLAADKGGHRIGYGKGFYDRLLAEVPPEVLKVGVSLAPLFDRFDFVENHDVRLDYCLTPNQICDCRD